MSQITWAEVLTKRPTGAQSWRNRTRKSLDAIVVADLSDISSRQKDQKE